MSEKEAVYQTEEEYRKDLVLLAKGYLLCYLRAKMQVLPDQSDKLYLFENTLLRAEVENFLSEAELISNCVEEEEQRICRKARTSLTTRLLPLEYLFVMFDSNPFERFCIVMLLASELDSGFSKVLAYLNNDWRRNSFTAEMLMVLYRIPGREQLNLYSFFFRECKLFQYFIEMPKERITGYLIDPVRLKSRIVSFILADEMMNEELKSFMQLYLPEEQPDLILTEVKPYRQMLDYLQNEDKQSTLFYLYGQSGIGKKLNVKSYAKERRQAVYFLNFEGYLGEIKRNKELLSSILFEVVLRQSLLCICCYKEGITEEVAHQLVLAELLTGLKDILPVVILVSDSSKRVYFHVDGISVIPIEMPVLNLKDNLNFWQELSKMYLVSPEINLVELSNKFLMTPGQIKEIFKEANDLSRWYGNEQISLSLLQRVCHERLEHNLAKKALKIASFYGWEDLVLPEYQKTMLKTACNQVKYKYKVYSEWGFEDKIAYGTGLSLIFSGSPGTGKTMAAQVIASELGLELYKIELASVVSKYIGETERNLNEIFEEAKKSQGIVFFDEADVLFSKRSEVKDSNDKYSNMEAAFLLQKIEEYSGIVILATNFLQNIDEAFKRRIKFLIDFPFPDMNYRKKLWSKVFPDKLPLATDIDYDFLSERFELSGSNIKNIAVNAAFLAAEGNVSVGMSHIVKSIVLEFIKSGKKLSKVDLGEYYMYQ